LKFLSKLNSNESDLHHWIKKYLEALNYLIKELRENYRKELDRIEIYYDDIERKQIEWIQKFCKHILTALERVIEIRKDAI
jgi:hypothetical protein